MVFISHGRETYSLSSRKFETFPMASLRQKCCAKHDKSWMWSQEVLSNIKYICCNWVIHETCQLLTIEIKSYVGLKVLYYPTTWLAFIKWCRSRLGGTWLHLCFYASCRSKLIEIVVEWKVVSIVVCGLSTKSRVAHLGFLGFLEILMLLTDHSWDYFDCWCSHYQKGLIFLHFVWIVTSNTCWVMRCHELNSSAFPHQSGVCDLFRDQDAHMVGWRSQKKQFETQCTGPSGFRLNS